MAAYQALTLELYESVLFSFLTLVLPVVFLTFLLSTALAGLLHRSWRKLPRGMTLGFIFCFALVGGVAGVIAGASMEAIVGAALTAILGLVSSLLAYLFAKESLKLWRPVIPLAIIALLASTLVGIVFGGSRRTQVLVQTQAMAWEKYQNEQIWAPVERERRLLLTRKCFAERDFDKAVADCVS